MNHSDFIKTNYLTMSDNEIAGRLGISADVVYRLRKKLGLSKTNWTHAWVKQPEATLFVRNEGIDLEKWKDETLEAMKKHAPVYDIELPKEDKGNLLIIDPSDTHIGKLSRDKGANYVDGIKGVLSKAQGFDISHVLFIIGNDALHVDTDRNTTTAGTPQDLEGRWEDAYLRARETYVSMIEMILGFKKNLSVVFNPGNHDYMSGFMLADALKCWFHTTRISFDVSNEPRKYLTWGANLIGCAHGDDMPAQNYAYLMPQERPVEWAETRFRYFYLHHYHHKKTVHMQGGTDFYGVTVEYLRSPSPIDDWHNKKGYLAPRTIEGFVHSKKEGQIARLTHYI